MEEKPKNENKETNQDNPEDKSHNTLQDKVIAPLVVLSVILVLVLYAVFVFPALKPSRFGATSVINQTEQEGYIDELFE